MKHKGLSLIEILISLAILSVILVATVPMVTVKTKHNFANFGEKDIWTIPDTPDATHPLTLQPNDDNFRNLIIGATGDENDNGIADNKSGSINTTDIAAEEGKLFVYNYGEANKDLPGINISKVLYFLGNTIDGSQEGRLTITNSNISDAKKHFLTLSDNEINVRNKLVVDNYDPDNPEKTNILIGNRNIINYTNTASGNPTEGTTIIGHAGVSAAIPDRNNTLYIFAGGDKPSIEANNNMIHIAGNLTVQDTTTLAAAAAPISARGQIYFCSDERLKNIKGEYKKGLNEILKIQPIEFNYKSDKTQKTKVGVIAQDLKKILPNAVSKGRDGYYRINESVVFYTLLNSIKELNNNYEKIKQNNDELEKQIAHLKLKKGNQR